MENWNRNDWQGRRKDQYESSALFTIIGLSIIIVLILGLAITSFIL